ncbi:MAG: GntR family transcriptional regulator [Gemmatimonadaceae bacterium]
MTKTLTAHQQRAVAHGDGPRAAYQQLRERIVTGRLAPGTRLVESEIAARLGVSRTPVRAALERLRQEGYIVGSVGTRLARATVAPLTDEDARELYQIVAHVEGLAAHGAAQKPNAVRRDMLRDMRRFNTGFLAAADAQLHKSNELHDLDQAFHARYVEAGAGPRLLALHNAIKPQAERYGLIYTSTLVSEVHTSAAEHQAIIDALDAGDAAAAERAVQTNWLNAAQRLTRVISTIGERGTW